MKPLTDAPAEGLTAIPMALESILIRLVLAFALGLLVAMVYRRTHKVIAHPHGMVLATVMVTMIVAMIMMVIGNSLARAFGMVGALSLIRFRTPVKDIVDIIYLFVAVGAGMAIGTGAYKVGTIGVVTILSAGYLVHLLKFGQDRIEEMLIKLFVYSGTPGRGASNDVGPILASYCKSYDLIELQSDADGASEIVYSVKMLDPSKVPEMIRRIRESGGVERVSVLSGIRNPDLQ